MAGNRYFLRSNSNKLLRIENRLFDQREMRFYTIPNLYSSTVSLGRVGVGVDVSVFVLVMTLAALYYILLRLLSIGRLDSLWLSLSKRKQTHSFTCHTTEFFNTKDEKEMV